MTAQIGGSPILCDRGFHDDRAWFARHYGRNHRLRKPIGGERAGLPPGPPKCKPLVVVKQLKPGSRVRVLCWVRERPPNSEAIAARLFNEAAEGWPEVVAIEAAVREGRL